MLIIVMLFVLSAVLIAAGYVLLMRKSSPAGPGLMLCAFIALTIAFTLLYSGGKDPSAGGFRPLRIAHAGGAVEGVTYTNSFDALELNLQKGFRYFELDFNYTSDGQLVCIHDWERSFERTFGFKAVGIPTLKEFMRLVKRGKYDNCTLERLVPWLEENPDAIIVTDVKVGNLQALKQMAEKVPGFGKRIIPQIYLPESYAVVKELGYEQVIWTLYRFNAPDRDVLRWVKVFQKGPFAITMPVKRAKTTLPGELARMGIPTYVHTINSKEDAEALMNGYGVTEIYTDSLYPEGG
ncbi:MAG: hypothetical protein KAR83_06530 [Thermodesulfovibrionales bacterium]|nr:hypothetical protein [Thermodesulfovibrionales bacterium]